MQVYSGHSFKWGEFRHQIHNDKDRKYKLTFEIHYRFSFIISSLPGNLYVYLSVHTDIITRSTRHSLFAVFSVVCLASLILFGLMIWRTFMKRRQTSNMKPKITIANMIETLKTSVRLLKTRHMLLLLIPFVYTGNV